MVILFKYFHFIVLFILFLSPLAYATEISLRDFIEHLLLNHPTVQKETLTPEITDLERRSMKGDEDWIFHSSMGYKVQDESEIVLPTETKEEVSLGVNFNRKIWKTGGRLEYYLQSLSSETRNLGPNQFSETKLAVGYRHPLLRNKNGFLDQFRYELMEYDIDISKLNQFENIESFMLEMANHFLDLVFYKEYTRILSERLSLSETELEQTQKKYQSNLVDKVDLLRSQDTVRIARQNLLLIKAQKKALRTKLSILAGYPALMNDEAAFDLYEVKDSSLLKESMKTNENRVLVIVDKRIRRLEEVKRSYQEDLKSDLSIVGEIGLRKTEEEHLDSLPADSPHSYLGLEWSFPLEKRREKTQLEKIEKEMRQLERIREEIYIELLSQQSFLKTLIEDYKEILSLNFEQIKSAHERTKEEEVIYQQGRGDFTFLIQSRDNEQNAKLNYATNALEYQKLILQLTALVDQLHKNSL